MRDKEIKKSNPAIDKVESIAGDKKQTAVETVFEKTDGVVVDNTTKISVDNNKLNNLKKKRDNEKVREKNRMVAEKGAKLELKKQKHAEKMKLKKSKAEQRAELRRAKAEERAYLKRVKVEQKHHRKSDNAVMREHRKQNKRNRGVGGWLAAVISLGVITLVLGSLLTASIFTDYLEFNKVNTNSANSQRAFYDFVGYVDNLETNMSKMFISTDSDGQQKVLSEIVTQSALADSALSELPIMDESKFLTSKYINQVGDYAKYLNNRLIDGEKLTEDEIMAFKELYNVNLKLKGILSELSVRIGEGYDFSALSKNDTNDAIIKQFNDIEQNTMDYPEMIYDGPFSDGVQGKKPKAIFGEEITEIDAIKEFENIFGDYGVDKVEVIGMVENSEIDCYNLIAQTEQNGEVFAQISKIGGKLIMFNAYKDCNGEDYSEAQCVKIAEEFLAKLGLNQTVCVWAYSSGSTEYLNFAYYQDGVTVYPDLIKVKVCKERGVVSGIDADSYYMNHTVREIGETKYTLSEAYEKVSKQLAVRSKCLTVIPTGGGNEKLAYEFIGEANGETYYLYLDANTLKQADVFKVVKTAQGTLLI